jgi:uncharacterized protein
MFIQQMSPEECFKTLSHARLGRLACAKDNQPYIVPIYFAFDQATPEDAYLYGFTTLGQRTEWMRANPRVCVEVDEVAGSDKWESLVVFGNYEELTDACECASDRQRAVRLLQEHSMWWEPGVANYVSKSQHDRPKPFAPIFYRIKIHQVTGHRCAGTPMPEQAADAEISEIRIRGWLRRLLRRVGLKLTT